MEQTFKYHQYLFILARKLPRISLGIISACWLPPLFLYIVVYHELYMPLIRLSLVASLTVIFVTLLLAMLLNELCNTVFIVSETGLVKKSPYKVKVIHFERATAFRFVKIPLLKGFGELCVPESRIRLSSLIDGLPDCIRAITKRLDACEKQGIYNAESIKAFSRQAYQYSRSIYRMQRTIPAVFQLCLWNMVGSAFVALVFWNAQFRWALCWAIIGLIFPLMGYLITELTLLRISDLRKAQIPEFVVDGPREGLGDGSEDQAYRIAMAITAFVYVASGIAFKLVIL